MAIVVNVVTPFGAATTSYARIASYSGDKTTASAVVEFFLDEAARTNGLPPLLTQTYSLAYPGEVSLLTGLYTALKAEPALVGAVDLI